MVCRVDREGVSRVAVERRIAELGVIPVDLGRTFADREADRVGEVL